MPKRNSKRAASKRKAARGPKADLHEWIRGMTEREAHELASQALAPIAPQSAPAPKSDDIGPEEQYFQNKPEITKALDKLHDTIGLAGMEMASFAVVVRHPDAGWAFAFERPIVGPAATILRMCHAASECAERFANLSQVSPGSETKPEPESAEQSAPPIETPRLATTHGAARGPVACESITARLTTPEGARHFAKELDRQHAALGGLELCDFFFELPLDGRPGESSSAQSWRLLYGPAGTADLAMRFLDVLIEGMAGAIGSATRDIVADRDEIVREAGSSIRTALELAFTDPTPPAKPTRRAALSSADTVRRLKAEVEKQDRPWGTAELDGAIGRNFVGLSVYFNDPDNHMIEYHSVRVAALSRDENAFERAIDGIIDIAISLDPEASVVVPLPGA